jgi:hypothetical protein
MAEEVDFIGIICLHLLAARYVATVNKAIVLAFHNQVDYSCATAPDLNRLLL